MSDDYIYDGKCYRTQYYILNRETGWWTNGTKPKMAERYDVFTLMNVGNFNPAKAWMHLQSVPTMDAARASIRARLMFKDGYTYENFIVLKPGETLVGRPIPTA